MKRGRVKPQPIKRRIRLMVLEAEPSFEDIKFGFPLEVVRARMREGETNLECEARLKRVMRFGKRRKRYKRWIRRVEVNEVIS